MPIKIISLNIEGKRHLKSKILPFLINESPDVICLQEVFESDIELIKNILLMSAVFLPVTYMKGHSVVEPWGQLILSKIPIKDSGHEYYHGDPKKMEVWNFGMNPNLILSGIVWIKIQYDATLYNIVTTHFLWSYNGEVSDLQRSSFKNLCESLNNFSELVLIGDFNTPRGGEIFSALKSRYKDNIPHNVHTTIDNSLHRSKLHLMLVVDGFFSSPRYRVTKVSVVDKLSDHLALIGFISRNSLFGEMKIKLLIYLSNTKFVLQKKSDTVLNTVPRTCNKIFRLTKNL